MTTEVLRNMLYAESPALAGLGYVVMDEVHYLADRFRGGRVGGVSIHLRRSVSWGALVSLSATGQQRGGVRRVGVVTVRGLTKVVVSEVRPVPLGQHMLVGKPGLRPVLAAAGGARRGSTGDTPRRHSTRERGASVVDPDWALRPRARAADWTPGRGAARARRETTRPSALPGAVRYDVVEPARSRRAWLPAITFVFSRTAATPPSHQCLLAGLRLTDEAERPRSPRSSTGAPARCRGGPARPRLLGVARGAAAGLAAHHAGLVPAFKETVEECFVRGLVKAVFATETLAPGHQHAGAQRRPRAAGEVERRGARRRDAGGVHPAHRPGRPPRHRRRGARRRRLGAGRWTRPSSPGWPAPARSR
jgi:ATP-dependent RNA helicase HelY